MRPITSDSLGIGLRTDHIADLCKPNHRKDIAFLELAPDNWMNIGGKKREQLETLADHYPLVAHGLSLSIGDTAPLNLDYINNIKTFLDDYAIDVYSEHLSFSRDDQGYLYDLLPIPRRPENIPYLADRIKTVQDILERPLILENITYYHRYSHEMPEQEFIAALIEASDCRLLLDINNLYINSKNHHYDPVVFMMDIPKHAIDYYHIAGHGVEKNDTLIDTHGHPVSAPVMALGQKIINSHGKKPVLLERDNNIPPLQTLCTELKVLSKHLSYGVSNESSDNITIRNRDHDTSDKISDGHICSAGH